MRWFLIFVRANLRALLIISLVGNLALGILNFVVQPIWRAAAVGSALALAEAKSEIEEKRAIAKARSKERAKARLRRMAVAIPVAGVAAASAFEYAAYQRWQVENPELNFEDYAAIVLSDSQDVAGEVATELAGIWPEWATPDAEALMATLERALENLSVIQGPEPSEEQK